jgi:hypothetical protein
MRSTSAELSSQRRQRVYLSSCSSSSAFFLVHLCTWLATDACAATLRLRDQQEANLPLIQDAKQRNEAIFRELGELKKQQKLLTDKFVEAERDRDEKKKEYVRLRRPGRPRFGH